MVPESSGSHNFRYFKSMPELRRSVIVVVPMMNIRIVRVAVDYWLVMMPMRMRARVSHRWISGSVPMLMMLIVNVRVCMIHCHVRVNVLVPLRKM